MSPRVIPNTARLTFFLIVLVIFIGCSEKPPTAPPPPIAVDLRLNIPVRVDDLNVELTLLSVLDDVRCSPGVGSCDWPGMATLSVQIVQGTDSNTVNLSIGGHLNPDDSRFLWPLDTLGLRLTLKQWLSDVSGRYWAAIVQVEKSSGHPLPPNIIITDLTPTAITVDPFNIDSAWIINDHLHMNVSYSGGCRRHLFSLFMAPETFIDSSPKAADLYLRHYGAGDACRALVQEEIIFNLGLMSQKYRFTYAIVEPFRLNLHVPAFNDNSERVIHLTFSPPSDVLP